jgi:hypothetical protein
MLFNDNILKIIINIMYNIDFLSHQPRVYVYKQDRYHSKIGIIMSFLSLMLILSLALYFIIVTFSRSNIFIRYSTTNKLPKVLNMTDSPLLFSITDPLTGPVQNAEKIYNFYLTYMAYTPGSGMFQDIVVLERCKQEYLKATPLEKLPFIDSYFCYHPGTKNLTIYNKFGDLAYGFGFINVYINKCSNTSLIYKGKDCFDSDTTNKALSKVSLAVVYLDNNIDHDNATNPYDSYIATEILDLSTTTFQRIYFNFKNALYETVDGFVFDTTTTVGFTQLDSIRLYNDNRASGLFPETFSSITIQVSDKTDVYNRSYIKLQNLLANIGGVANGIIIVANIIMSFLTTRLNSVGLIEHLFNLEEKRDFHTHSAVEVNRLSSTSVIKFKNSTPQLTELRRINMNACKNANNNVTNINTNTNTNKNVNVNDELANSCDNVTHKPSLKLNLFEYLCPFNLGIRKDSNLYLLNKYEQVVRNELSIDNIINKSGEVIKLVELLTLEQKAQFRKMNALNLTKLKLEGK